jgi:hypothetical protein
VACIWQECMYQAMLDKWHAEHTFHPARPPEHGMRYRNFDFAEERIARYQEPISGWQAYVRKIRRCNIDRRRERQVWPGERAGIAFTKAPRKLDPFAPPKWNLPENISNIG